MLAKILTTANIVIIIETIVILLGVTQIIIEYRKNKKKNKERDEREIEISLSISQAICELAPLTKGAMDNEKSLEFERYLRRIALFTRDSDLINQSLFWFSQNGNRADIIYIQRAISYKVFEDAHIILANQILSKLHNQ